MTYEEAYQKLQEIAVALAKSDISLDDAVKLFEQSVALGKTCLEKLKETEGKIQVFKGELEELKPLFVE
jgi:exodeoxyribonuclease VII small subunit